MKHFLKHLLIFNLFIFATPILYANNDSILSVSKFAVGIENNRLFWGEYIYKDHFTARLNVSAYSEKLGYQYVRGTIGYRTGLKMFNLQGSLFYGSALNRSYYNLGATIAVGTCLVDRLLLDAKLAPWYDSGYNYKTCWEAKVGCKLTKHIDIKAGYTTLPEYRMSENRILAGFDFHTRYLYVTPYLSIGTKSKDGGKNIRVLIGFGYTF